MAHSSEEEPANVKLPLFFHSNCIDLPPFPGGISLQKERALMLTNYRSIQAT